MIKSNMEKIFVFFHICCKKGTCICYKPCHILERSLPVSFSDRQVWANSEDPDQRATSVDPEQSDQVLQCFPFYVHLLEISLHG